MALDRYPLITSDVLPHRAQDWLVGNTLSGADIMMSFIAEIATEQGMGNLFPNIAAYTLRLQARPAWQAAMLKTEPYKYAILAPQL